VADESIARDRGRARLWRTCAAILAALALISAAVNYQLARVALRYFDETEAIRLDPLGLGFYAEERSTIPPGHEPTVVLFGDSRARMWSMPAPMPGYRIFNRGIGQQTTSQIVPRVGPDLLSLHPAVVVLEAGVNDLKAIASFPERRREIVARCERNLETIVDQCRDAGANVVIVTVFDIGDIELWRRPFWSNDIEKAVHEVNAFLRTLAGGKVVVFDANRVLDDSRGKIQPAYQLDYLHLNTAGYTALNRRLLPMLSALP